MSIKVAIKVHIKKKESKNNQVTKIKLEEIVLSLSAVKWMYVFLIMYKVDKVWCLWQINEVQEIFFSPFFSGKVQWINPWTVSKKKKKRVEWFNWVKSHAVFNPVRKT